MADRPYYLASDAGPSAAEDAAEAAEAGAEPDGGVVAPDAAAPDAEPGPQAGRSLRLTAVDQGLVGDQAGFMPSEGRPRTVELWARIQRVARAARLFGYGGVDGKFEVQLSVTPQGGQLAVDDGTAVVSSTVTAALADGEWHHLAVTVASRGAGGPLEVAFYVDGQLTGTATKSVVDATRAASRRLVVGGTAADPRGFVLIDLDELRLWSVARTAQEIADHRRARVSDATGLVGYWPLEANGNGPGLREDNLATVTGSATAPNLVTEGRVETLVDPPF